MMYQTNVGNVEQMHIFSTIQILGIDTNSNEKDIPSLDAKHQLFDVNAVTVMANKVIKVHQSVVGNFTYISGSFSDLNWAALAGLTRAIAMIIPVILDIKKDDVIFRIGFLVSDTHLTPAAQFVLTESLQSSLGQRQLMDAIQKSFGLLSDKKLHEYIEPTEGDMAQWRTVQTAQIARQEIPGKQLPFTLTLASNQLQESSQIGFELAPSKGQKQEEQAESKVGYLTGYCTHERIIHFKTHGSRGPIDISFNEEKFIEEVFLFARKNPPAVNVKWCNLMVDGVIVSRTLLAVEPVMDQLL